MDPNAPTARVPIAELLKDIGVLRTVAVVTHAETLAELANQVLHIEGGQLSVNATGGREAKKWDGRPTGESSHAYDRQGGGKGAGNG